MNRDDIIRLGRESQRECFSDGGHWFSMEVRDLERFAALVAAAAEQPKPKPVGVMQESCVMEGLVISVVTQELPVGTPLYAAPPDTEALRRETERLREELRQSSIDYTRAEVERLREEIDALRTDAERYRWLREHKFKHNGHCFALTGPILWETTLDAAIDEAMKQAALQGETAIWAARHDPRE